MTRIELTRFELLFAANVGVSRYVEAICQQRPETVPQQNDNRWQRQIEGACGEMAVAKCLGRYWNGSINTFRDGGDVGKLQVKTASKDYGLIVRTDARDEDVFFYVLGKAPVYEVWGWIRAADAKAERGREDESPWWKDLGGYGRFAFVVPKERLATRGIPTTQLQSS